MISFSFLIFALTAAMAATASPLGKPGGNLKEKLIPSLVSPLTVENHGIDVLRDFFYFLFNFCRYSGAGGNGVAFEKVWGYPKSKTDPDF